MDAELRRPRTYQRSELLRGGAGDHDIARQVRRHELQRVRPGAFVTPEDWASSYPEQRQRALAHAAQAAAPTSDVIFSHLTAAALWGLPLFRRRDTRVHTISPSGPVASSTRTVLRHAGWCDDLDIVAIDGLRATSLARTVFDVSRMVSLETAVAVADAALRLAGRKKGTRELDLDAAETLRGDIHAFVDLSGGARGIRTARFIAPFADARAERPGESISRLYLHQLGFAPPALQVRVRGPRGEDYEVDFEFDEAFGEFDGLGKYTDPTMLGGRTSQQALIDEKRREDWIRGTTGKRFVRWSMEHITSRHTLAARLADFGIYAPR